MSIPQTVLRGRNNNGTWNDRDRILALALTAYEDGLCSGCGLHRSVSHGDENVGRHETAVTICHGCEPIEALHADKNRDTYPGQKVHLVDTWVD